MSDKKERLYVHAQHRPALDRGRTITLLFTVTAANSTVNGRCADSTHDAGEWFDGWGNLGVNDQRSYVDGGAAKLTGKQKGNFFGGGRNKGFSCGEYLHAPLIGTAADGRWYRVRCRWEPGDVLAMRKGLRVQITKVAISRTKPRHWCVSLRRAA